MRNVLLAITVAVGAVSCRPVAQTEGPRPGTGRAEPAAPVSTPAQSRPKLKVFADTPLRAALIEIGEAFRRDSGQQIDFVFDASPAIVVMDAGGKNLKVLTDGQGNYGFPSWSPDGREIVCRISDGKTSGLIILDAETGKSRELKTGSTQVNFPAWSPAGDVIAFTNYIDGDYELCTVKPDGTGFKRLTNSPGSDAHCAWSSDGKWIAFTSGRGGFQDEAPLHPHNAQPYGKIHVMKADGTDVLQLTDDAYEHGTVAFVPTAKK